MIFLMNNSGALEIWGPRAIARIAHVVIRPCVHLHQKIKDQRILAEILKFQPCIENVHFSNSEVKSKPTILLNAKYFSFDSVVCAGIF